MRLVYNNQSKHVFPHRLVTVLAFLLNNIHRPACRERHTPCAYKKPTSTTNALLNSPPCKAYLLQRLVKYDRVRKKKNICSCNTRKPCLWKSGFWLGCEGQENPAHLRILIRTFAAQQWWNYCIQGGAYQLTEKANILYAVLFRRKLFKKKKTPQKNLFVSFDTQNWTICSLKNILKNPRGPYTITMNILLT